MQVIGLISGTSVDGIDAALVDITGDVTAISVELLSGATYPYPASLRSHILDVCAGKPLSMAEFAELDDAIAHQFAQAALQIQATHPTATLIGSHGQTVFHKPPQPISADSSLPLSLSLPPTATQQQATSSPFPLGYSLQLGRGALIANLTGISTISNFRAADIAAGGQGAPLVSPIDACLLGHPTLSRCIQNIGGIGNVTYLPAQPQRHGQSPSSSSQIVGWDTGPGNALLDLAVHQLSGGTQSYDQNGNWAASGTPDQSLVAHWLQHDFFHQPPPKSTGRELFGQAYWDQCALDAIAATLSSADLLASLTELTAAAIAHSYQTFLPQMPDQVLVCGGGSRNRYLMQRLQALLSPSAVLTTDDAGLNADFKEAIAFAVLAYWRMHGVPGNLPQVTGAQQPALLGEIHMAGQFSHVNITCHLHSPSRYCD